VGVLALLLASAAAATGQRPDTLPDTLRLPVIPLPALEVTVTRSALPADRVPFAITAVDVTQLHPARHGVDLHEALRGVPGVLVGNRHNLAMDTRVVVRGFGARSAFGVRGVRMILDGIPLTLADGQATLTNVDLASIGRAEVLRGPAAALYGNAAGGVIALTTREPPAEGELEGRVTAGSYGTGDALNLVRYQAHAGATRDLDSWFVGVSHLSSDGFRDYSRARRSGLNARYRRSLSTRTAVTAILHVAAVPLAENPGALPLDSALARPRMAWPQNVSTGSSKEVSQAQGGVALTHLAGPVLLEAGAYGLGRDMDNPLPFGRYIQLRRSGGGGRLVVRDAGWASVSWALGLEAHVQRDDRLERDNVAGEMTGGVHQDRVDRVTSYAPFAFVQASPAPRLSLRVGGRYDGVLFDSSDRLGATPDERVARRALDAWSGSTGILVDLGEGHRAWSSVSTWFQTPTTTELINVPPAAGEPCCQAGFNPELEPQDGWGWEAGIGGGGLPVRWEVVAYDLRVRNEILPYQVEGVAGRDFYRNAGRSAHRGLELAVTGSVGSAWGAALAYSYSDFRFVEPANPALAGNRLPGVPPHRLDGRLAWRKAGSTLGADVEWLDRYPVDDANTAFAPAYLLIDLRAARAFRTRGGTIEPFVALTNLGDTRYSASVVINAFGGRYHEPGPGRALVTGVRATFR
jgi:iron complex outermembrane recepter protein